MRLDEDFKNEVEETGRTPTLEELNDKVARLERDFEDFRDDIDYDNFSNRVKNDIRQTAKKISLIVQDGSSSSLIVLTPEFAAIVAGDISIAGYVTFNSLITAGQTAINGSNIITGTINASLVNITNLSADNIKVGTIQWDRIAKPIQFSSYYALNSMDDIAGKPLSQAPSNVLSLLCANIMNAYSYTRAIHDGLRLLGLFY